VRSPVNPQRAKQTVAMSANPCKADNVSGQLPLFDKAAAEKLLNDAGWVRSKTVLTDIGEVEIEVPRDREGSFEPRIVAKRQKRLSGVEEMVISLSAKGLTTGEISAHLAEVYGAQVSRQTISTITDKVVEGMVEWQNRPLDPAGVSGGVHRRDPRQGPRWSGLEPADLCRVGGHL
jgi:hypothetical protein